MCNPSPGEVVKRLLIAAAPERQSEIDDLWSRYNPRVELVETPGKLTLCADKATIKFDPRTFELFWLIGFSAWHAIATYEPAVIVATRDKRPVADVLAEDEGLPEVERDYKERLAAAALYLQAVDPDSAPWPPDVPRPVVNREDIGADPQLMASFDLTVLAAAAILAHELYHVVLYVDGRRPADRRDEENACDAWARDFLLASVTDTSSVDLVRVLRKRAMAIAVGGLILYEITPEWDRGGCRDYFSIATRLRTLLRATKLPDDDPFWIFLAALLVGVCRRGGIPIDTPPLSPKGLAGALTEKLPGGDAE